MDPLSILSIAAAVVAFVDFGGKILNSASHHLRRDDDLTTALEDLAREAGQLGRLGRRIESTHGQPESSASQNPEFDAVLVELARESTLVSEDVETLISTLQTTNGNRKATTSLRLHLLKTVKDGGSEYSATERKVRKAEQRLSSIKSAMMSAVLACLCTRADSRSTADEIRRISLYIGKEHTRSSAPATASPPEPELSLSAEEHQRQQLIHQIWSQSSGPSDQFESLGGDIEVDSASLRLPPVSQVELQQAVLRSLQSNEMEERRSGISPAHEKTFQWIFERPQDTGDELADAPPWSDFVSWLEQDDTSRIYWITEPPIFYSWNAGSDDQRPEHGLLRSIFHQYLTQMPELVPGVCPRRWAMHRVFGTSRGVMLPSWTKTELRQAFDMLLPLARQSNQKLVLLIDGLDEFQVTDNFRFLLSFAETVRSEGGAKVCASSREWTMFTDYFRAHPSLRLQDLTRNDIEQYIYSHLNKSIAYAELKDSNTEDVDRLVGSLLDKASGVFLWVRIVTDVVLAGMEAGQTVNELNASVEELPPDLSDLYQGIWERLGPRDQTSVARLLRILEASVGPLDPTTMFAAEQPDAAEALKTSKVALEKLVARRLRSQTRGLLEISEIRTINYLHRTARDWSLTVEDEMQKMLPPDFDPNLQLCLAKVAITTILCTPKGWNLSFAELWDRIGGCLEYASRAAVRPKKCANATKLIAALDSLDTWVAEFREYFDLRKSRGFGEEIHWSSYQFSLHFTPGRDPDLVPHVNTFLGLASQYAILAYVEQKLKECPKLVKPKRYEVSLLENALFVPGAKPGRPFGLEESPGLWRLRFLQREALVRLLLDRGADPRAESLLLCHVPRLVKGLILMPKGRRVAAAARALPLYKTLPSLSGVGNKTFWEPVQTMLDENMKNRGTISRLRSLLSL
ncbi:hypothetical protein QBC33DRAFT_621203 [Phialemonium atrogriseum]|uniref:Nephrocystin 3-like N-terminal domain-containing protein n=1 Tax=Phialemonium atrogriseum TaxID=1093897 RepID=A0AAJ0BYF6_9PEZI|nr:uncharacterized protein QBC33DRAFT_621203 [Phialemonium atrogriseum]KAK1765409.1 hypothetical protein QBC33DRAFT_621203 [Phialemonium atrogriseum]